MSQPGINQLKIWAAGKPRFLVLLAMSVLPHAGMISEFLRIIVRRHEVARLIPPPNAGAWTIYYRDHISWAKQLFRDVGMDIQEGVDLIDYLAQLRRFSVWARTEPDQLKAELIREFETMPQSEIEKLYNSQQAVWDEMLEGSYRDSISTDLSPDESEEIGKAIGLDAVQFLIRIWLPCWAIHGRQPGEMYASARRGNTEALEALLRIDKTRLSDPLLMRHVTDAAYRPASGMYRRLSSAIADQSMSIPTPKQMKTRFAALVAQWSTRAGHRISAAEIRCLYDIIAKVRDAKPIDTDFKGTPEAFSKAISRQPVWSLSVADKN